METSISLPFPRIVWHNLCPQFKMNFYIWLTLLSSCLAVVHANCLTLPVVDNAGNNATAPGPFPDGTTVQFQCHDGYTPSGNRLYVCSGSAWIDGNFICEEIFCRYVETPANGYLHDSPTYEVGSFMTFRCNEGYTMKGSSRLICRIDGRWSPELAPVCEIKNCGEFGEVMHGSTFQDNSDTERNTYGSVVEVTCDRGYMINGSPRVTCDKDGNWGTSPVCNAIECDPYPRLNADCVVNTRLSGQLLFIACRRDVSVTKTGPSLVKCINNRWDPDPDVTLVACFCDCKVNVDSSTMSVRNLEADGYLKHNDTLEWSCKKNGKKANSQPLKCHDGRMETPECILIPNPVTTVDVTGLPITTNPMNNTKPPEKDSQNLTIILSTVGAVIVCAIVGGIVAWKYCKKGGNNSDSKEKKKMVPNTTEKAESPQEDALPLKPKSFP